MSSAWAFCVGALLPLIAVLIAPVALRIPVTVVAVLLALVVTGVVSAALGGRRKTVRHFAISSVAAWPSRSPTLIGHLVGVAIA